MDDIKPSNEVILARLTCPVREKSEHVTGICRDLRRAVRQLQRSTGACEACPARRDCPVLLNFQESVQEAIREVVSELGLEV
jgi:hypothetical protein